MLYNSTIRLLLYKPIKMCTFESLLNDTKYYIVCEYVEVTGFFWRIIHDSEGNLSNIYVKLTGTDFNDEGTNYFTDSILHSGCKFVFYGNYIDNSLNSDFNELFIHDEYLTFRVDDWDIIGPIIRFSDSLFEILAAPKFYLYDNDFY